MVQALTKRETAGHLAIELVDGLFGSDPRGVENIKNEFIRMEEPLIGRIGEIVAKYSQ